MQVWMCLCRKVRRNQCRRPRAGVWIASLWCGSVNGGSGGPDLRHHTHTLDGMHACALVWSLFPFSWHALYFCRIPCILQLGFWGRKLHQHSLTTWRTHAQTRC